MSIKIIKSFINFTIFHNNILIDILRYFSFNFFLVSIVFLQKNKSFRKKSTTDLTTLENNNGPCSRKFLVEAPCAMSPPHLPLNAKPRHLFLFTDLLLVAKPRSHGNFKLKVNQTIFFFQNFFHKNYYTSYRKVFVYLNYGWHHVLNRTPASY